MSERWRRELGEARRWIEERAVIDGGFYLIAEDGRHDHGRVYCERHACRAARLLTAIRRVHHHASACWAGDDNARTCHIATCAVALDTGPLTTDGIDSALGITEEKPHLIVADIAELELAARAMDADDPRWQTWLRQARYHQRKARATDPRGDYRTEAEVAEDSKRRAVAMWMLRTAGADYKTIGEAFGVTVSRASELVRKGARVIARNAVRPATGTPAEPPWMQRLRAAGALPLAIEWEDDRHATWYPHNRRQQRRDLVEAIATDLRKKEDNEP